MKNNLYLGEIKQFIDSIFSVLKETDGNDHTEGKITLEVPVVKRIRKGKTFFQIPDTDNNFQKEKIIRIKISELKLTPATPTMAEFLKELNNPPIPKD